MKHEQPPKLPSWLLEHFSHTMDNDALAGDLAEQYRRGRSTVWYWKQVLATLLSWKGNLFMKRALIHTVIIAAIFVLGFSIGRNPIFQPVVVPPIDRDAAMVKAYVQQLVQRDQAGRTVMFLKAQLARLEAERAPKDVIENFRNKLKAAELWSGRR